MERWGVSHLEIGCRKKPGEVKMNTSARYFIVPAIVVVALIVGMFMSWKSREKSSDDLQYSETIGRMEGLAAGVLGFKYAGNDRSSIKNDLSGLANYENPAIGWRHEDYYDKDSWGNSFCFSYTSSNFVIRSAGIDTYMKTEDDAVLVCFEEYWVRVVGTETTRVDKVLGILLEKLENDGKEKGERVTP
jgi:hypothetical protein